MGQQEQEKCRGDGDQEEQSEVPEDVAEFLAENGEGPARGHTGLRGSDTGHVQNAGHPRAMLFSNGIPQTDNLPDSRQNAQADPNGLARRNSGEVLPPGLVHLDGSGTQIEIGHTDAQQSANDASEEQDPGSQVHVHLLESLK